MTSAGWRLLKVLQPSWGRWIFTFTMESRNRAQKTYAPLITRNKIKSRTCTFIFTGYFYYWFLDYNSSLERFDFMMYWTIRIPAILSGSWRVFSVCAWSRRVRLPLMTRFMRISSKVLWSATAVTSHLYMAVSSLVALRIRSVAGPRITARFSKSPTNNKNRGQSWCMSKFP